MLTRQAAVGCLTVLLLGTVLTPQPAAAALPRILDQEAAAARRLPAMPSWARGPTYRGPNEWKAYTIKQEKQNRDIIRGADRAGTTYDFVVYGDSTLRMALRNAEDEWNRLFNGANWTSACLGVSGNDIEDVAWRLISGAEKPKNPPRVLATLIGTNNVHIRQSPSLIASRMEYIVEWVQAAFPETKVLIINLLPKSGEDVAPANKALKKMAAKRGVTFSTCGHDIDPSDPIMLYDGSHPAEAGGIKIWRCLKPVVAKLAGKA